MNFNITEIINGKKNHLNTTSKEKLVPGVRALGAFTPFLFKMDKQGEVTVLFHNQLKKSALSVMLGSQSILGVRNTNST